MKTKILSLSLLTITLLFTTGCTDKEKSESLTEGGMKCGAGKCGSSMVDGSAVLVKKKMNILDQLDKKDARRDCILKAKTTKALYNCVRDPKTGRLTIEDKSNAFIAVEKKKPIQKEVPKKAVQKKEEAAMKCAAGKCSGGK